MPTKSTEHRNAIADRWVDNLDEIEITDTSTGDVIVTWTGASWDPAANGTATLAEKLSAEAQNSVSDETAMEATIRDSGDSGEEVTGLSVGDSDAHIVLDNTSVNEGQTIELESGAVTIPADIQAA